MWVLTYKNTGEVLGVFEHAYLAREAVRQALQGRPGVPDWEKQSGSIYESWYGGHDEKRFVLEHQPLRKTVDGDLVRAINAKLQRGSSI